MTMKKKTKETITVFIFGILFGLSFGLGMSFTYIKKYYQLNRKYQSTVKECSEVWLKEPIQKRHLKTIGD